ncbi:MAG: response regulator [Alphaproteobacteria bacterium]|nr:response regulator [Alphaproteobacteria bacterium]
MRTLVKVLLHSMGIREVREATDGAHAFDELRLRAADIVICDLLMSPLDGNDFTRLLRQAQDSPNRFIPIIMLTGYSERRKVEAARDAGVNEFLRKPITARSLYQRVIEVVERPRPFIQSADYFGPDRRRRKADNPALHGSRRAEDRGESPDIVYLTE